MGALTGFRVLEMAAIGPLPFCAMLLSDMGAEVVRIDRLGEATQAFAMDHTKDVVSRGRKSIALDVKNPAGRDAVLRMCEKADVILEGFRPGVMERLGLGPDDCLKRNPKIIFGRATGWGQTGPLASTAGHDINYLAMGGVLHGIGHAGSRPVPPINLVGDYGGGGMLLALGVLAALLEATKSGTGQVVDAAMIDGASQLQAVLFGLAAMGQWREQRGTNILDSGCFYYDTYETADGKFMSVGPLEPKFFAAMLKGLDLAADAFPNRENPQNWPTYRVKLEAAFRRKSQAEWTAIFAGTDACVAPVLTMSEAAQAAHSIDRNAFITEGGVTQPAPAPRFSRTPSAVQGPPVAPGAQGADILKGCGWSDADIETLINAGAAKR